MLNINNNISNNNAIINNYINNIKYSFHIFIIDRIN